MKIKIKITVTPELVYSLKRDLTTLDMSPITQHFFESMLSSIQIQMDKENQSFEKITKILFDMQEKRYDTGRQ